MSSGAVAISGVVASATAAALGSSAITVAVGIKVHDVEGTHEVGVDGRGHTVILLWNIDERGDEHHKGVVVISGVTGRNEGGGSDGKELEDHS